MESNLFLSRGGTSRSLSHRTIPLPLQRSQSPDVPEDDIYRGSDPQSLLPDAPKPVLRMNSPEPAQSVNSSLFSISSAPTRLVTRAIAAVVELAISRWARSSASSTT